MNSNLDYPQKINKVMIDSETSSIQMLANIGTNNPYRGHTWNCSSTLVDTLRFRSWGRNVIGATVPHPLEMLCKMTRTSSFCPDNENPSINAAYVCTSLPIGLIDYENTRGLLGVYLESRTPESTSLLQSWEKEVKVPILERSAKLRNVIHWFIEPDSNLATSIPSIMYGLNGEDWSSSLEASKEQVLPFTDFTLLDKAQVDLLQ